MNPTVLDRLKQMVANNEKGLRGKTAAADLLFVDALALVEKQAHALKMAAERFDDLGAIVSRDGGYDNAGFMRASARRCRELDF